MVLAILNWTSERNDFSNSVSMSLRCLPSSLAESGLQFGKRCHLKNFKMATMAAILDIGTEKFSTFNLYIAPMPPIKLRLNLTYGFRGDVV